MTNKTPRTLTRNPCARILCDMNLTISVDDDLLRRARDLASRRGISLQELLREHLRSLVAHRSGEDVAAELLDLMEREGGRSGGRRFRREDAYEDRP